MKIYAIFIGLVILLAGFTGCKQVSTQGNGELITREIHMNDFNKIVLYGLDMTFNYEQKADTAPYLKLTIDNNLYDLLKIETKENTLIIAPKEKQNNLRPTQFIVNAHSSCLEEIKMAGSVEFNVNSVLSGTNLYSEMAGSCRLNLNSSTTVEKLKTQTAGNGSFRALYLRCSEFTSKTVGKSNIYLGGQINSASFDIAGKGTIKALDCTINDFAIKVAGKGNIEATINRKAAIQAAGSLTLKYKKGPSSSFSISKQIAGNATIVELN